MIGEMVARVREIDPQFFDRFDNAPMEELPEWRRAAIAQSRGGGAGARIRRAAGRAHLNADGLFAGGAARLAEAYRAVSASREPDCSDTEALDRMLNPARNTYRLETLNVGVHAPIMRALQHANFTFAKKISHTADSQDQRHRMVPGSRPLLALTDTRAAGLPHAHAHSPKTRAPGSLRARHGRRLGGQELAAGRGVPPEIALYLLPNAKAIRLVESGSLLHLLHKWTMRTCFNAQEEIYQASMEEVEQVRAVLPALGRYSARHATFAPESPRRSAPKARTSAA